MSGDCPICRNNAGKWEKVGPPYWHLGSVLMQDYVCSTRGCRYVATKLISGEKENGKETVVFENKVLG